MPAMKVAISLPDPVFKAAEHLAHELHIPRSQLYAEALTAYLGKHGAKAITAKLNAVYADSSSQVDHELAQAQLRTLSREAW
jgi:metal-responsive CopG/Arc/MetJ family transcriptional regulator